MWLLLWGVVHGNDLFWLFTAISKTFPEYSLSQPSSALASDGPNVKHIDEPAIIKYKPFGHNYHVAHTKAASENFRIYMHSPCTGESPAMKAEILLLIISMRFGTHQNNIISAVRLTVGRRQRLSNWMRAALRIMFGQIKIRSRRAEKRHTERERERSFFDFIVNLLTRNFVCEFVIRNKAHQPRYYTNMWWSIGAKNCDQKQLKKTRFAKLACGAHIRWTSGHRLIEQ